VTGRRGSLTPQQRRRARVLGGSAFDTAWSAELTPVGRSISHSAASRSG